MDVMLQAQPVACEYDIFDVKRQMIKLLESEPAVRIADNTSRTDNAAAAS